MSKPNGYWNNYENCYNEAKKYSSRSEFFKNCSGAYNKSLKNKWLDSFTWLKSKLIKESINYGSVYWVYGYFDFGSKTCYIGLSRDKKRHWRHKQSYDGKFDSVMSYFNKKYGFLPEPIILEEDLTAVEAQNKESYYIRFFTERKYRILNKAKPGSLGGGIIKWDEKSCYEEAKKYTSIGDFRNNSGSAYRAALKNKWINDYTWLQRKILKLDFWNNYENCYNEAKKYKTKVEFARGAPSAYNSARRNNWLENYNWFENGNKLYAERIRKWTYKTTKSEALKYKSRWDFGKNNEAAYKVALQNKWLDDFFPK